MPSLRRIVREATGQNISRCAGCLDCEVDSPDVDVPLGSIIHMAMLDDEECLTCRTLWSEDVLHKATHSCAEGLDLKQVILALRSEAARRGLSV